MARLKLVVFDCDGVMFDSRNANRMYYNHLLEAFDCPPMDAEEEEYVHTHNVFDSLAHIFRKYPGALDPAHAYRESLDYSPYLQYMRIEPDLKEFLQFLRPRFRTAISTNRSSTMPAIMEMHRLSPYFDLVVTALDVERPKPHAEALEKILRYFGLGADQAVYIGDSDVDREHVAGVNMRLIAFRNPALEADYHVNSFRDIRGLPIFDE